MTKTTTVAYDAILADLAVCIDSTAELPAQVFRQACAFRVMEWDLMWSARFFEFASALTTAAGSDSFNLLVLDPDPDKYFRRRFGALPLLTFSTSDIAAAYIDRINADPGDSPADAVIYNSNIVAVWPATKLWCLYGHRDFEISVIATQDNHVLKAIDNAKLPTYTMAEAVGAGIVSVRESDDTRKLLHNFARTSCETDSSS